MIDWFLVKWWLRGFFWLPPYPYHSAGRAWSHGSMISTLIFFALVIALFLAVPFFIGRWTAT